LIKDGKFMNFFRKISLGSLAAAAAAVNLSAAAQAIREQPSRVVFSRTIFKGKAVDRTLETYSWGTQKLPAHRIANANNDFMHYTVGTNKPSGAKTQTLSFRFRSKGLFSANPEAHFAAVGRAESYSWGNRGRGFIVGGIYDKPNPCAVGVRSQPETWWTNQSLGKAYSAEWNGSFCGENLSDNIWYEAYLRLDDGSGFIYEIKQNGKLVGGGAYLVDKLNQENDLIDQKPTGFIFAVVKAKNLSLPWTLEFDRINVQWL